MRDVDKNIVIPLLKEQIKVENELKYRKAERNMAIDLLSIEDDDEER